MLTTGKGVRNEHAPYGRGVGITDTPKIKGLLRFEEALDDPLLGLVHICDGRTVSAAAFFHQVPSCVIMPCGGASIR